MRNVWAIGDLAGEPMLAHRAMAQGEMVAEIIAGHRRDFATAAIPGGLLHRSRDRRGRPVAGGGAQGRATRSQVGQFPFAANGRALTMRAEEGFVRVVARADNHLVLGSRRSARRVASWLAAFALAIEMGARLEDVAGTIHAHPTLGEAFHEASLRALGEAPHI